MNSSETQRPLSHPPRVLSQRAHRLLIGYLGLCLPVLLYVVSGLRPTAGLAGWRLLSSVSAYYYTGAVGIFVGVLFALSLFLLTYQGYQGVLVDRVIGRIGGCAALGVALFPTSAPAGVTEPSWWTHLSQTVHYISAVVLFVSFILFAIWLFRKSSTPRWRDRPVEKRWRDTVCLVCGVAMTLSLLWAATSIITSAPIFWPETVAIVAFAISWLAKGEADHTVRRAARWLTSHGARRSS